jgi:hypothetical protein
MRQKSGKAPAPARGARTRLYVPARGAILQDVVQDGAMSCGSLGWGPHLFMIYKGFYKGFIKV